MADDDPSASRPSTGASTPSASRRAKRRSPARWRAGAPRNAIGGAGRSPSARGYCCAAVEAMLAMGEEIPAELAWQMGRPVRYGAGEIRGFEERARYMIAIAEDALAPIDPGPKDGFQPLDRARAARPRAGRRAVELSLSDGGQLGRAGADGGQCGDPETRRADAAGRRALPARFRRGGLPEGLFQNSLRSTHAQTAARSSRRAASTRSISPARSPAARRSRRAAAGAFLGVGLELGGKDPAYVRADADLAAGDREARRRRLLQFRPVAAAASSASMSTSASTTISSTASSR